MPFFSLKKSIVLFGLVSLIFVFSFKEAEAASNDILVYFTRISGASAEIFTTDLTSLGYNTTIKYRSAADELGTTAAAIVNLLDYGQVWIIDDCGGVSFTAAEITSVETFRNNGGGLLLSADNTGCLERVNQIAQKFNGNTDIFFGNQPTGGFCISPIFTWTDYPTKHPLYSGLTYLTSSDSDAEFNRQVAQ